MIALESVSWAAEGIGVGAEAAALSPRLLLMPPPPEPEVEAETDTEQPASPLRADATPERAARSETPTTVRSTGEGASADVDAETGDEGEEDEELSSRQEPEMVASEATGWVTTIKHGKRFVTSKVAPQLSHSFPSLPQPLHRWAHPLHSPCTALHCTCKPCTALAQLSGSWWAASTQVRQSTGSRQAHAEQWVRRAATDRALSKSKAEAQQRNADVGEKTKSSAVRGPARAHSSSPIRSQRPSAPTRPRGAPSHKRRRPRLRPSAPFEYCAEFRLLCRVLPLRGSFPRNLFAEQRSCNAHHHAPPSPLAGRGGHDRAQDLARA